MLDDDYLFVDADFDVQLIALDPTAPSIHVAITGGPGPGVFAYNGVSWYQTTSRVFIRRPGEPVPPDLVANDIVFQKN